MERLGELQSLIEAGRAGYEKYEGYFTELEAAYACQMDPKIKENLARRKKSRTFFPYFRAKTERLLVAFTAAYFTNRKLVKLEPMDQYSTATNEAVKMTEQALAYYQKKTTDTYLLLNKAFLDVAVKGTCICKVFWDPSIDAPRIEHIELRDGYVDPGASRAADMQFFVHRIPLTTEGIEALRQLPGFSIPAELGAPEDSEQNDYALPDKYRRSIMYDVYEKHGNYWTVSSLIGNHIVRDNVILNDGFPIFIGTSLPQCVSEDERDTVNLYGTSPVETLLPLQQAMNQTRNQVVDALSLQLDPKYISVIGSGVNPNDLKGGPGSVIPTLSKGALELVPPPNINQAIFDINQLNLEMQQASGITDYNQGVNNQNLNQTATGVVTLTNEANQKIEFLIRGLNETLIQPMFAHYAQLVWAYGADRFFENVMLDRAVPLELIASAETGLGSTNSTLKAQGIREAMNIVATLGMSGAATALLMQLLPVIGITDIESIQRGIENDAQARAQQLAGEQPREGFNSRAV